jgi:glycine dehydrogenase subunit 1
MTLLGEAGLARLARINHANAVDLAGRLDEVEGVEVLNRSFFNEFTIRVGADAGALVEQLAAQGIFAGVPASRLWPGENLDDLLLVASTEVNSTEDRAAFAAALKGAL